MKTRVSSVEADQSCAKPLQDSHTNTEKVTSI